MSESTVGKLILAIQAGELERVRAMLDAGVSPALRDDARRITLLGAATANAKPEIVKLLLERGADPNEPYGDQHAMTPLHVVANSEWWHYAKVRPALLPAWVETARVLLAAGADVDRRTIHGAAPLHFAARRRSLAIATVLVEHGADVDARDHRGVAPLHDLMVGMTRQPGEPAGERLACIELLVARGANLDAVDANGDTALHVGAQSAAPERDALRLLVARGARVVLRNRAGWTFAELFDARGKRRIDATVAYTPSAAPQVLTFECACVAFDPSERLVGAQALASTLAQMYSPFSLVALGAAGGREFAPELGSAEVLELPAGPSPFRFRVRVTAMSGRFLRFVVDWLRDLTWVRAAVPIVAVAITSDATSRAPGGAPGAVVDTAQLASWLDDAAAYAERWPAATCPVTVKASRTASPQQLTVKVAFDAPIEAAARDQLLAIVSTWASALAHLRTDGNRRWPGRQIQIRGLETDDRAITYRVGAFKEPVDLCVPREPAVALLANMLERFHTTVARIRVTVTC